MNDKTWIFGKAISPLFADRVTYGFSSTFDLASLKWGLSLSHHLTVTKWASLLPVSI